MGTGTETDAIRSSAPRSEALQPPQQKRRFVLQRVAAILALVLAIAAAAMGATQWSTVSTDAAAATEATTWADTGMVGASPDEIAFARADADRANADLAYHRELAAGFLAGSALLTAIAVRMWMMASRRRAPPARPAA